MLVFCVMGVMLVLGCMMVKKDGVCIYENWLKLMEKRFDVPEDLADNNCMMNKEENEKVWEVIRKYIEVNESVNVWRYNNKRKNDRVIVWKSYGNGGYGELYVKIVEELNELFGGYELVESSSLYGDGSVWGVKKVISA